MIVGIFSDDWKNNKKIVTTLHLFGDSESGTTAEMRQYLYSVTRPAGLKKTLLKITRSTEILTTPDIGISIETEQGGGE